MMIILDELSARKVGAFEFSRIYGEIEPDKKRIGIVFSDTLLSSHKQWYVRVSASKGYFRRFICSG